MCCGRGKDTFLHKIVISLLDWMVLQKKKMEIKRLYAVFCLGGELIPFPRLSLLLEDLAFVP